MESPSQYQNNEPNTSRSFAEHALDIGCSCDWITPAYAIARNAFGDGQTIIVDSDLWAPLHAQLDRFGVDVWAVSIQWIDVAYFAVFSIHAEDLPRVNSLLGNYGEEPVERLPRWRAWLALALVVLVMLATVALVGMVGGAL
ncbi:MAG: hypothetical protein KAX65_01730 [Caldilineaceae bacterium]|nr:hypothetical protein [Caldilineaceae bacterium]